MFIDLDISKEREFGAIIYYIKNNNKIEKYPPKTVIKSIIFFSRFFKNIKIYYWPTELEIADIIWVIKKIRYFIKLTLITTTIFIDYNINVSIIK